MRRILHILGAVVLLFALSTSCKRKTELEVPGTSYTKPKERISQNIASHPHIKTIDAKIQVSLSDGKKDFTVKGALKFERDQSLIVSIQPFLGIEVVRALFTPDTICILDRLKKRYVAIDVETYRKKLPVDVRFETMQSLFLNEMFTLHHETFKAKDEREFDWRTETSGDLVGQYKGSNQFALSFFLNPENLLVKTQVASASKSHTVNWNYTDFKSIEQGYFPYRSDINYRSNSRNLTASLAYTRMTINKPVDMSFKIPNSYTKLELTDLINAILPK